MPENMFDGVDAFNLTWACDVVVIETDDERKVYRAAPGDSHIMLIGPKDPSGAYLHASATKPTTFINEVAPPIS